MLDLIGSLVAKGGSALLEGAKDWLSSSQAKQIAMRVVQTGVEKGGRKLLDEYERKKKITSRSGKPRA